MAIKIRKFAEVVENRVAPAPGREREVETFLTQWRGGSFPWLASIEPKEPVYYRGIIYFNKQIFTSDREPLNSTEHEEIVLRIKKAIFDEDIELSSLRANVSHLEAALRYEQSGPRRDPIPDDVKIVVWARDGGACVRCGAKAALQFDHIIPLAKGGGNSEENIQILCQPCNLRKSDKIA